MKNEKETKLEKEPEMWETTAPEQESEKEIVTNQQNGKEVKETENGNAEAKTDEAMKSRTEELKEIIALIREAEEAGYARGRQDERADYSKRMMAELEKTRDMWHNHRLAEAEAEEQVRAGDEFLKKVRPSVWD